MGIFNNIFFELSRPAVNDGKVRIDASHLKTHLTVATLLKKGFFLRCIGLTKCGLNAKLHTLATEKGSLLLLPSQKAR